MKKRFMKQKVAVGLCTALLVSQTGIISTLGFSIPVEKEQRFSARVQTPSDATSSKLDDEDILDEDGNFNISTDSNALATPSQLNKLIKSPEEYIVKDYGESIHGRIVPLGTSAEDAAALFPNSLELNVYVADDEDKNVEKMRFNVSWEAPEDYDADTPGAYEFRLVLPGNVSDDIIHKETVYISAGSVEVKFFFDQTVADPEYARYFNVYADNVSGYETRRLDSGYEEGQFYLVYKIEDCPGVNYKCSNRIYGYGWDRPAEYSFQYKAGMEPIEMTLVKQPSCTVQFNVTLETDNGTVTPKVTVWDDVDNGLELNPIASDVPYQYEIQLLEGVGSIQNTDFSYVVEAEGYAPVTGLYPLTAEYEDTVVEIPVILTSKQSIEDIRDKTWGVNGEQELEISKPEQMAQYSYLVNSGEVDFTQRTVRLTDDIDLSSILWTSIGNNCPVGHFDGQGHSVKIDILNWTQSHPAIRTAGLFGITGAKEIDGVTFYSIIENVTVEGSIQIESTQPVYVGGIVGYGFYAIISNCRSEVDIQVQSTAQLKVGGVGGFVAPGIMADSQFNGTIDIPTIANGSSVGGIGGHINKCLTTACESFGLIQAGKFSACHVGGIAGTFGYGGNGDTSTMTACRSSMEITGKIGIAANSYDIGGIAGNTDSATILQNCYFDGLVAEGESAAAICAKTNRNSSIKNCAYTDGSGPAGTISGSTPVTSDMTPEAVLAILNGELSIPCWRWNYSLATPVLITESTEPVLLTDLPTELIVWEGMKLDLWVDAKSNDGGTLAYQWYHNGTMIDGAVQPSYQVSSTVDVDAGEYYVEITNTNGRGEASEPIISGICTVYSLSFKNIKVSTGDYPGGWTNKDVLIRLTEGMLDGLSGYEYLAADTAAEPFSDDNRWTACEGANQDSLFVGNEGTVYYWFRMRSVDGKRSKAEGPLMVQIDKTAPQVSRPVVPDDRITENQMQFTVEVPDELSGFDAIYYLVRKAEEAEPDLEAVKNGERVAGHLVTVAGLTAGTDYVVYAAATDRAGNFSAVVSAAFQTKTKTETGDGQGNTPEHDSGSSSDEGLGSSSDGAGASGGSAALNDITQGNWILDVAGWRFQKTNGSHAQNQWLACLSNNRLDWYHFNKDGYMETGWFTDADGRRYYLNETSDGNKGRIYVGWNWIGSSCYYFETVRGNYIGHLYQSETTPDEYTVDAEGRWIVDGVVQTR